MDIKKLVNVSSRGWALPILAAMASGVPRRQAALITATGAGRTAFRQSLDHLIALGLVERNPGHGHPLRPEFRLTVEGSEMAAAAGRIEGLKPGAKGPDLLRRSWTMPVLAVTQSPRFFGEIRERLSPVTDRALSASLSQLCRVDWLAREILTTDPTPRPRYRAIGAGAEMGAEFARVIGGD